VGRRERIGCEKNEIMWRVGGDEMGSEGGGGRGGRDKIVRGGEEMGGRTGGNRART